MKTIQLELNPQSIKAAIDRLKQAKKNIGVAWKAFLAASCEWIIKRANEYVDESDVGINVINDIKSSWTYTVSDNGAVITNSSKKAAYVEFGVGIVGGLDKHPMADEAGYDYNMPSPHKRFGGAWHFFSNEADLDIPEYAVTWGLDTGKFVHSSRWGKTDSRHRMHIYTRGVEGALYAFNAIEDYRTSGIIQKLWNEAGERYL